MEELNLHLQAKYRLIAEQETRYELVQGEDAEYLIVAFGLAARIAHKAVEILREQGVKVGLFRPITLYPFPTAVLREMAPRLRGILDVEMNAGQMVEDVRLSVEGRTPVAFYGRMGGVIPSPEEVVKALHQMVVSSPKHAEA